MRLARTLKLGAWILVVFNLLMAFGAIGVFSRMSPAIADIISKNDRSLQSGEQMLAALLLAQENSADPAKLEKKFLTALSDAKNNITEPEEKERLDVIEQNYRQAFADNSQHIALLVGEILRLNRINREAMSLADKRAQQLGRGGAWGVVFMAAVVFLAGITFIRKLDQSLLEPVEEIRSVLVAHQSGENRRRCTAAHISADMRVIFNSLNSILDKSIKSEFED